MEKNKMKIGTIFVLVIFAVILCGCGKNYTDYPNLWENEEGTVTINPTNGTARITMDFIDENKKNQNINVLSDCGMSYLYFCYGDIGDAYTNDCIWEAKATIKQDKLYLDIVKDYYGLMEGEQIVLSQIE